MLRVLPLVALIGLCGGCRRHHAVPPVLSEPAVTARVRPLAPKTPTEPIAPPPIWRPRATAARPRPVLADLGVIKKTRVAGTVNGDPNGPKAEALNAVVKAAMPRMQACLDAVQSPPSATGLTVHIHYAISPAGKTSGVAVKGPVPDGARNCLSAVVTQLKFPEFKGDPVENTFPFSYRRDRN